MALPEATVAHYRRQQEFTAETLFEARRAWRHMGRDFDASWRRVGTQLFVLMARMQQAAARDALSSVAPVLGELDLSAPPAARVNIRPLIGVASDGRSLDSLLYEPVIAAKSAVTAKASTAEALSSGWASLEAIVLTQIPDAARVAAGLGIATRPRLTGYVRMLNPPSCSRCAVLAGKWYRWNEGFQRHPRCDCRHIPASEDVAGDLRTDPDAYFRSLSEAEQNKAFTKAGAQAIRDGADIGQVVNARRGMSTAQVFGQRLQITSEGTTKRGLAGKRLIGAGSDAVKLPGQRYRRAVAPRLMPESIYAIARDREDALRLLRRNGYLI